MSMQTQRYLDQSRWFSWLCQRCGRLVQGGLPIGVLLAILGAAPVGAEPPRSPDQVESCEILIAGGGLAGAAAAYEALQAGRTVCMTEITDWVGGQISAQGTSALDEGPQTRTTDFYPHGYLELRRRMQEFYGRSNPGQCWVSFVCFIPRDGERVLQQMLQEAAHRGGGTLKWFPNTVVKDLEIEGAQITSVVAIQHQPQPGTPALNTEPLSQTIADAYQYTDSERFQKTILQFVPPPLESAQASSVAARWYVLDATETGEIIALADVPYRLGIDPRSYWEPSAAPPEGDPYCTQGFTYTFAMEYTAEPQTHEPPPFYDRFTSYYSYVRPDLADFGVIFTYRRIWSPITGERTRFRGWSFTMPTPGDISMQNWEWGNDYRPGTAEDNLVYTREQLQGTGQLQPGGWQGGLRIESLAKGEQQAIGYFYWIVAGTTDARLGEGVKTPVPNNRFLKGLDSPMGTVHGLSKYPYIREGRRIIGRPSKTYPNGFTIWETDISRNDFQDEAYRSRLSSTDQRNLWISLAGLDTIAAIRADQPEPQRRRTRAFIYPDSVGIAQYPIDFHVCMSKSPPYIMGSEERLEVKDLAAGRPYPFQIPLRAMIPQKLDNLLVAGKSIATSHITAAAYRIHAFEWAAGAGAGTTATFALERGILPYQLVDDLPRAEPELERLQQRLIDNQNPIAFPGTSIFNNNWENWR